eukprot:4191948-Prymnesium_polylepis.1
MQRVRTQPGRPSMAAVIKLGCSVRCVSPGQRLSSGTGRDSRHKECPTTWLAPVARPAGPVTSSAMLAWMVEFGSVFSGPSMAEK